MHDKLRKRRSTDKDPLSERLGKSLDTARARGVELFRMEITNASGGRTHAVAGRSHLVAVDLDPEEDREAWLESRRQGHGGSDVAKIVGEHPTEGPIDVFLASTGASVGFAENERTRGGRFLEPFVIDWFATGSPAWPRTGGQFRVVKPPSVYHRDRPWQRGSADGLGYYPEVIAHLGDGVDLLRSMVAPSFMLEVKTHGWLGSRGYNLDDEDSPLISVPPDKRIQCAWYMALYDVDLAFLAALVDTHLRRTFAIPRDRDLEAMLLEEVDTFRRRYILTGEPPPPDGRPSYREYLRGRFKTHGAELVSSTPAVDLAVETLIALKRDEKQAKKDRELAEQTIKACIGDQEGVRTAHGVVTWRSQPSGKLRSKEALAELYAVAGWTDDEISAFEERHKLPDNRVLRTPTIK
jgi:predicted phage-related endonuclease